MSTREAREAALEYLRLGWQPVAAPIRGKAPVGAWKRWQTERVTERDVEQAFPGVANVFLITGSVSGLCVLDCDDEAAESYWRNKLGSEVLDAAPRVKTGGGWHYYFRLAPGRVERGRSSPGGEQGKWDLRAEGGGVIAPPSVHPSGRRYEWHEGRGPEHIQDAPAALFERQEGEGSPDGSARSMLSHLLAHPPAEGNRNNWLAQIAGHYAKHIPHFDAFQTMVEQAAGQCTPPLPDDEVQKLIKSIWQSEQAKGGRVAEPVDEESEDEVWRANLQEPTDETGWLVSGGSRILVQIREKRDDRYELGLAPWLDCDIRVLGVVESDTDQIFGVELRFPDGRRREDHLPAKTIADSRALHSWLATHGASIGVPDPIWPSKMRENTRLLRYLIAQGAEPMEATEALGWHPESKAFITHEGIIRASGPAAFEHVRPDPGVRGWAPYRYGHRGLDEARMVLREVLTFHDERVAAVFGAWWAAVLLKPQIQDRTSQFPFMALEASSESGKTTGFFSLMLQLGGSTQGQSNPTRAALRDALSAHNNGYGWVDDLDDLDDIGELLRNVTVGGSLVKKGDGNHEQVVAKLRAALVVSGESLGLHDQKALIDRSVLLDVPSPTARTSKRGDYPQWDDIVTLRDRYPDLTCIAGSVVQLALQQEDLVREIRGLRVGVGRHADTLATVRLGARILHAMTGGRDEEKWLVDEADAWAAEAAAGYNGAENVLTLKLIPRCLRSTGWRVRPEGPDQNHRHVATPCFVQDDIVWFSPKLLAEWWEREPPINKRLNPRVESAKALEQQARELGLGGKTGDARKDFRLVTGESKMRYWRATPELSATLLERSREE